MPDDKLLPRNRSARRAQARAAGNPVVTELEAGVGNCFPGLEIDLRNLERRFFPFLAVDFVGGQVVVAEVDLDGARAAGAPAPLLDGLTRISGTLPSVTWQITALIGEFAGYGRRTFDLQSLGADAPSDPWTAVRLLRPGVEVQVTFLRASGAGTGANQVVLSAARASYLDDDGAFAEMFEPGELTQSLCSPWTHDFRDCGCWYWASNHPDLVLPALPAGTEPTDPDWGRRALWLRADRTTQPPPPADDQHSGELAHHEINTRWQDLDLVLDGREQRAAYEPSAVAGVPLPAGQLVPTLRYAAGVEIGVMLEYLAAVYSVDPQAGASGSDLRDDARAARAEVLRVAISEMRHLRVINQMLAELDPPAAGARFVPALGVATLLPGPPNAPRPPVQFRTLTPAVLADFIQIERPSTDNVDGLYTRILATLETAGAAAHAATIRSVMAEGADHYATFRNVAEWLGRHTGTPYLRNLTAAPTGHPALATVQQRYETVLDHLHRGYSAGLPAGGAEVATARLAMLGNDGLDAACEALARAGFVARFAVPADPRFAAVAPPA